MILENKKTIIGCICLFILAINIYNIPINNQINATEKIYTKDIINKNGLLIVFTCNHCPYAIALWDRLIRDTQKNTRITI